MLSDEQVIRRILKGHTEDFRALVQRHQGVAYRLAFRILGRREEAEDAVQETFLQVYRSLPTYKDKGRFWAWVRRILVNTCLKRLSPEIPSDYVEELADPRGDFVEAEVLRRMALEDVRRVIAGLPDIYRTAVVLRYEQDLSYREISEILEEPVTTIQVRLHRAKKMLAARLAVIVEDEV